MKKLLLLSEKGIDRLMAKKSEFNVNCYAAFSKTHRIMRKIRDFWQIYKLPYFCEIFSALSAKEISQYDIVIIREGIFYFDVLKYIRKYNAHCRLIIFFLNSFAGMEGIYKNIFLQTINMTNREKYRYEVWSFDKKDCNEFNLLYNNSYLMKLDMPYIEEKYDISFFGRDKGRLNFLKHFTHKLDEMNISYNIKLSPDRNRQYNVEDKKFFLEDTMSYDAFVKKELEAKCLLEVVLDGQADITYRALEAQFYKRKLITNCQNIKNYDFYTQNNIFIIGANLISDLPKFLQASYEPLPVNTIKKYQFDGWLENFVIDK